MSVLADARSRLTDLARSQKARYSGGEERPLGGYVGTMAVYTAVVGTVAGITRLTNHELPEEVSAKDIVLSAVAAHKLSRLVTKDPVTSPLRAPFTEFQGTQAPSELSEEVRGQGAQKAIGELLTCPFCVDLWVATAMMTGLVFLPRPTRLAISTFATLAGADMLQFVYAWLLQNAELAAPVAARQVSAPFQHRGHDGRGAADTPDPLLPRAVRHAGGLRHIRPGPRAAGSPGLDQPRGAVVAGPGVP
jgi:hypothetical protein